MHFGRYLEYFRFHTSGVAHACFSLPFVFDLLVQTSLRGYFNAVFTLLPKQEKPASRQDAANYDQRRRVAEHGGRWCSSVSLLLTVLTLNEAKMPTLISPFSVQMCCLRCYQDKHI